MSEATTRVRSTTRPSRLLVPSARSEQAVVRMAGATMAVRTANGLSPRIDIAFCSALLRVLLDGAYFVTAEMHKHCFVRRVPVNPVFSIVAVGVTFADFAVRLPHRRDHFFTIHPEDRVALGDGFFRFRRQRVNPVHGRGALFGEIEKGRKN